LAGDLALVTCGQCTNYSAGCTNDTCWDSLRWRYWPQSELQRNLSGRN